MKTTYQKLETMVQNIWWSWQPEALSLFQDLNKHAFIESGNNPKVALQKALPEVLQDASFVARVDKVYESFEAYMNRPSPTEYPQIGYFCMEYGLHESLTFYSGGLGILAGDHTKAASDLALPFHAVGLFLRDGYFRQSFTPDGWQAQSYRVVAPNDLPLQLVTHPDGTPIILTIHIGSEPLHMIAWKLCIGKTNLYLLDTDIDANPPTLRDLTKRLYAGDNETRIMQEMVLGIGGVRLFRALNLEIDVFHLNEGHCSFLTLELLREELEEGNAHQEAMQRVIEKTVFTTHTPVEAGHDRFSPALVLEKMQSMRKELALSEMEFLGLGRTNPFDTEALFNMTLLGFKLSHKQNGVSRLNGILSRRMWKDMWDLEDENEVPITHITNGVHLQTWAAPPAQQFLNTYLPKWQTNGHQTDFWKQVKVIPNEALWALRNQLRRRLIDYILAKIPTQTINQVANFNPNALTIGFARRFATYKRATLLFSDIDRLVHIMNQPEHPIQFVFAGKAHPRDENGKKLIQTIYQMTHHPALKGKIVLLENYNMEVGRYMVSGADVWLNNPRRPMEASGTSGQKVAIHGGLNLSILDGWWPEGYAGNNGWAIGHDASADINDPAIQDPEDANFLYELLENEIIPRFYDQNENGIPQAWVDMMKEAMTSLVYPFSAERMLRDYIDQIYTNPVLV